jgi:hypothetical protein
MIYEFSGASLPILGLAKNEFFRRVAMWRHPWHRDPPTRQGGAGR